MSTGLEASTVTPGRTAPDVSFTTPVNALCARAIDGNNKHPSATMRTTWIRLLDMRNPPESGSAVVELTGCYGAAPGRSTAKWHLEMSWGRELRKVGSGSAVRRKPAGDPSAGFTFWR